MQRRYIVGLFGLVLLAACLDRKTGNAVDGAVFPDSASGETAMPPGAGGAPGIDVRPSPDLRPAVDGPAPFDLPITSPDTLPGVGGVMGAGTGGSLSAGTGGLLGTGGGFLPANGGATAGAGGAMAGTGGIAARGGSVVTGTGGAAGTGTGGRSGAGGATANPDAPPALPPNGSTCTLGTACASGNCVDGVCCNNPCTGCKACKSTLTGQADGLCSFVKPGLDPHDTCADETPTNQCGNDGQCDGSGACRKVGTSHLCKAATCDGSTFTAASYCTGNGTCNTQEPKACPTGEACSGGACACISPNLPCGGVCINPKTDAKNCGSCGHDCLTGSCSDSRCSPALVAANLGVYSSIFGVDGQYIHYSDCTAPSTCDIRYISKTSLAGTGTLVISNVSTGFAQIGSTVFINRNRNPAFLCDISSTCDPDNPSMHLPTTGVFASFKSPSPANFAIVDSYSGTSTGYVTWYSPKNVQVNGFSWLYTDSGLGDVSAYGNSVYWKQNNGGLYGTSGFPLPTLVQLAGGLSNNQVAIDTNAQSILLKDEVLNATYRVPLPAGLGTGAPVPVSGVVALTAITEDSAGLYWVDAGGNVRKCATPPSCSTNVTLTGGTTMASNARLYQDTAALYWVTSQAQIVRLAK